MENRTALLHTGEQIKYFPEKLLGQGAEKEFFATSNPDLVIGFYRNSRGNNTEEMMKRLSSIIDQYNPNKDHGKSNVRNRYWNNYFSWPQAIVTEPSIGILCPIFPAKYYFNDIQSEKKGKWFSTQGLSDKTSDGRDLDLKNRLKICHHMAKGISRMHMAGLCHSDLSGNNILMDPITGTCLLIDIDSLVVPGVCPAKVLGTKGYSAPEVVATSHLSLKHPKKILPSIRTDLHALAVIIYETLLMRHPLVGKKVHSQNPEEDDQLLYGEKALFIEHPGDSSNRSEKLHSTIQDFDPYISKLFIQAFVKGIKTPHERPTAMEWEKAMIKSLDLLYPCQGKGCRHKWFLYRDDRAPECKSCGVKIPFQVPVMHLFDRFKSGQYVYTGQYITIHDNKKIFDYHTCSDVVYPECGEKKYMDNQGIFRRLSEQWQFENSKSKKICFPFLNMQKCKSITLLNGQMIRLSRSRNGRVGMIIYKN